ncbi:MAG TPA: MFS transporter [Trueperaceae bacterium]
MAWAEENAETEQGTAGAEELVGAAGKETHVRAAAAAEVPAQAYLVFLVFVIAYFFSYFFRSTNAVIADDLSRDLSLTAAQLGLMTSLFFLTFGAAQVPLGAALDRFGARFVTSGLMLAAVVGALLFSAAQSFAALALGRALIGLGMAGILMGSLKAFSGWFPPQRFATVSGLFLGLGSLGALAAATPLAALNEAFGWRVIFLGGAGLILLAALGIGLFGRQAPGADLVAASDRGSLVQVFVSLDFWRIGLLGFAVTGSMFAYQGLWAGPYLVDRAGLEPIAAGNLLLLMGVGVSGGYMVVGWLADRLGHARTTAAGALGMLLVQLVLAFFPARSYPELLALLFLLFGLFGAFNVLFYALIRLAFPLNMTGRAITAVNFLGMIGSALLQWLLGVVIGLFPTSSSGGYPAEAYTTALLVTSGLILVTLAFYWPLLRRPSDIATDEG